VVLLTGASGFLGGFINNVFKSNSIDVLTLGRNQDSDIIFDLASDIPDLSSFNSIRRVIHVAGKAHESTKQQVNDLDFLRVNFCGTVHLCKALEKLTILPDQFVFISSVAVYGAESGTLITEKHPLNGKSQYAISKLKAEEYLCEWGEKNNVKILILRLPLVIGEHAPGSLRKLIRAIKSGFYVRIGNGKIQKSMVVAQDVAQLIFKSSGSAGIYNLTDRIHPTLKELEQVIMKNHKVKFIFSLPFVLVKSIARMGDFLPFLPVNSILINKLIHSLTFDDQKAVLELNWKPKSVLDSFF
jgi:nucleoside-diphosphate-sugar epimerase